MKTCSRCKTQKKADEFYHHPKTKDRRASHCKDCSKLYAREREERLKADPEAWVAERRRQREKSRKARAEGRATVSPSPPEADPLKKAARTMVGNAIRDGKMVREPCRICGETAHAHHEDYSRPLQVVWLCPRHHHERHVYLRDCEVLGVEPSPL
jgi:hypothetical protein